MQILQTDLYNNRKQNEKSFTSRRAKLKIILCASGEDDNDQLQNLEKDYDEWENGSITYSMMAGTEDEKIKHNPKLDNNKVDMIINLLGFSKEISAGSRKPMK